MKPLAPAQLSRHRAALLVVDIQERLLPAMAEAAASRVVKHTAILIEAAMRLKLPIVVSQQYPRGLGPTVQPIEAALLPAGGFAGPRGTGTEIYRFDKLEFSAAAAPAFAALTPQLQRRDQWIVTGMETHVCVYQTARDLAARGQQVHVVADAVCSRTDDNYRIGLGLMERAGALITSTEVCVFDLLERAGSDEFKLLSKLIK